MTAGLQSRRIGADIGGTFTDVVLDVGGRINLIKVLTDHAAPERAIIAGVEAVITAAELAPSDIDLIVHGTTMATNALIERNGAKTAFITTNGFRDVLEMGTESRFEQYNLDITLPQPLVERKDRFVLRERIAASGAVLLAPHSAEVDALAEAIMSCDYKSVAVGFIHSYANPVHEQLMRRAIQLYRPDMPVSISSEVSPQIREFERFTTVCANAYVQPAIQAYLRRLREALGNIGVRAPIFIMHSGGGLISVEDAAAFPVRLVESGPAGGAMFAADIARRHNLPAVVSFDMGGTTAKLCLVEDQIPKTAKTFEVARSYRFRKGSGMPISIPAVEMVEIGAGGGSIARVDALGQIRVGPHSAGSDPGPACYARGGVKATVTDADLVLGKLDPDDFASSGIRLSVDRARVALHDSVGAILDLPWQATAYGVCEMVDEDMANAGRAHAIENGKDLSSFTMIAFGGAGPLHAARLCEKLGIAQFVVPPGAGVGSAIGFLRTPFAYEAIRSSLVQLRNFHAPAVNALLTAMTEEAVGFVRDGLGKRVPVIERTAFMRYAGQGWDIPVTLPLDDFTDADAQTFALLYEDTYARFFGRTIKGPDIEVVSWAVKAGSPPPPIVRLPAVRSRRVIRSVDTRLVFDAERRRLVDAAVFDRYTLKTGDTVIGPAIIAEHETSTFVSSFFNATVLPDGCLLVHRA